MKHTRLLSVLLPLVMLLSLLATIPAAAAPMRDPSTVTVTFDGNLADDTYTSVTIPSGGKLQESNLPALKDHDGWHFCGWGTAPDSRRTDTFDLDKAIGYNMTLYAVWEREIDTLDLYIRTPSAGEKARDPQAATFGWYGCAEIDREATAGGYWWDDASKVYTYSESANFRGYFEAGKTYYGVLVLKPDLARCFTKNTTFNLIGGAKFYSRSLFDEANNLVRLYFSVTIPTQKTIGSIELFASRMQPRDHMKNAGPCFCLTSGVESEPIDIWWEKPEDVDENYETVLYGEDRFEPGKTYYSYFQLFPFGEDAAIAEKPTVQLYGGKVETLKWEYVGDDSYLYVIYSLQVPEVYPMTAIVETEPSTELHGGGFYDDLDGCWTAAIDGPNYPAGTRTLTAKARHGFYFDGWYDAMVYGEPALLTRDPVLTIDHDRMQCLICRFKKGEGGVIGEVRLTAELPVTGDKYVYPAPAAVLAGDYHCTLTSAVWYNDGGICPDEIVFEAGERYFIGVILRAEEGYILDETTKVYINDKLVDSWSQVNEVEWSGARWYTFGVSGTPFIDVPEGSYFLQPVNWAVGLAITNGVDATHFAPDDVCTRAQIVTFLWRATGCPKPQRTDNPFKDVSKDAYYYDAVLWAVENDITNGTAADRFSPDAGCTRGQVVTFLWRSEGKPAHASSANPFKDVSGGYYFDAVLWAIERKITNGTAADAFSPEDTCTRAQIVTFLYRTLAN